MDFDFPQDLKNIMFSYVPYFQLEVTIRKRACCNESYSDFKDKMLVLLHDTQNSFSKKDKLTKAKEIFDFIAQNTLHMNEHLKFRNTTIRKLVEFANDNDRDVINLAQESTDKIFGLSLELLTFFHEQINEIGADYF